jgi:peptide chain release factor subunit 1
MLTETNLQELLVYQSEHPVLSLYLNTDPMEGNADLYKMNLRRLLKNINLPSDAQAVENYFNREFDRIGRSTVVFSCAPDGYLRAFSLAIPVRNQVHVNNRPYVKPLVSLLDNYGGYGVVLVDKQGARLFSFHLGEIKEQEGILGESIRHTKHGGSSAKTGMRGGMSGQTHYEDQLAERNIRDVADFAAHFFADHNVRRVVIGGTDENNALLRTQLPKSWQSLIVGTFPMSMTAGKDEVLERTMEIGREAEFRKEEQMLKKLVTGAAKEQRAVLSLDGTLSAIHDGRVQALVIQDGYQEPGYACQGCGYLTAVELPECQYCGSSFKEIPDAVEMAVHNIMRAGGEVEVLQHAHKVDGFENIGALLRY